MSSLDWLTGNDPTKAGSPKLVWANFPESWGVFVLLAAVAAIVYGVFWLYRREINTCPPALKMVLAVLRLGVLLLLLILFLKPSVFYQQVNETKPVVALLRDRSLSMDRGDRYREQDQADKLARISGLDPNRIASSEHRRSEIVNRIFERQPDIVHQMRDRGSIRIVDFADGNQSVALISATHNDPSSTTDQRSSTDTDPPSADNPPPVSAPPLIADGLGTDIWLALKETLDDSSRVSSVVLITDGQHNGTQDPLELARKAASLDKPIFVIGVGDPHPPRNLSVNEVFTRDRAYPDEPFEIEAVLQSSQVGELGMPDQVNVQLIQQRVDDRTRELGEPESVATKSVPLPAAGGRTRVDFEHVMNRPGSYVYSIAVDPVEHETETADNQKSAPEMQVVDEKIRVLLISGLPSWDYQHLQRLLQRDPSISLSCWLQSMDESRPQEGDDPINRLPRSMEELGKYNIVMLLDPNPEEFDRQWMELLQTFCRQKAGGVLYMAGPHFSSEFVTMNRLTGIREMLPVRIGNDEFISSIEALTDVRDSTGGKMLPVAHHLNHPVMSFRNDDAQNQKIWSLMPGTIWSFPTLDAKPTSHVLLERGDQVNAEGNPPLMVAGRFGAGTVLYMGFQGAWRWRSVGVQAQYYDRFWIQVVRFLVETRSLQGSRRGVLDLEKTEFELGNRINLMGRVLDAQFKPLVKDEIQAVIRSGDGRLQQIAMKRVPQQEGRYEGSFIAQRTGNYIATIELDGDDDTSIEPVSFRIVTPSAESDSFWLNEALLREIAKLSGGKYYRLEEIAAMPADIPSITTRAEFNGPPEPLWDVNPTLRWLVWFLPVILLTIEWAIRKWKKLL